LNEKSDLGGQAPAAQLVARELIVKAIATVTPFAPARGLSGGFEDEPAVCGMNSDEMSIATPACSISMAARKTHLEYAAKRPA
jgi:hypothetical protein